MTGNTSLLTVKNLSVVFPSFKGDVCAVNNISFSMGREKLGIVGESGSGKSVTGRAVLRLLPPYARVRASEISLRGKNLLDFSEKQMRKIRGMEISMVMQDPKYSLNPGYWSHVPNSRCFSCKNVENHKPEDQVRIHKKLIKNIAAQPCKDCHNHEMRNGQKFFEPVTAQAG